ncbi:MAG TPA: 23S rRNA (uracil(1939)-C(5))-methyltransferase RlmD [Silvibacterium sp.]|nr:23S rRNA (uracil(1939)-C(5))-methyltransferase RlmD [Silvibacterium sp.]
MKLRVEKSIYGGAGLARADGKAIFVPFALPGELVEAHVTEDRTSYASAELESVLEASPMRVSPPCAYFGECGGCHYQEANYAQQLEMKVQILRETLERAHLKEIPGIAIVQGEPLGYRNRIRLHVDRSSSMLCYKRRGSHANLAVNACPIAAPVLEDALRTFQSFGQQWRLGEHFDEMELFTNAEQCSILVTLWSAGDARAATHQLQQLWPQLVESIPQIGGAAVLSSERGKQQGGMLAQAGSQALSYHSASRDYRVSLGSFFQVNRFLIDALVELVVAEDSGAVAWDLYAGVGLFARALTSHFEQVVAVESAARSVRDLRHNLDGGGHRVAASSTLDFLRRTRKTKQPWPDFVVVDPPRAGLGKEVTTLLGEIRPEHITYVSCDPATLSRDLKSLLDSGYHLRSMYMVDLFPQTFHLESVAMLSLS